MRYKLQTIVISMSTALAIIFTAGSEQANPRNKMNGITLNGIQVNGLRGNGTMLNYQLSTATLNGKAGQNIQLEGGQLVVQLQKR